MSRLRKLTGVETFGSRSLISHGAALTTAAKEIVEKGRKLAAGEFEVEPTDVTFDKGQYRVVGTDLSIGIMTLIGKRWGEAVHPLATNTTIDLATAFPSGAHVAEVEIDPETGATNIVNYVTADHCGEIYNHKLVEGQLHGGLMQGIGQVFGEHIVYDPDSGQLLSGSFMDYFMPRAHNLAPVTLIDCGVPSPANSLGAKGAGEAGATGSVPALANAVLDALKSVNVRKLEMPYTPYPIWLAIHDARKRRVNETERDSSSVAEARSWRARVARRLGNGRPCKRSSQPFMPSAIALTPFANRSTNYAESTTPNDADRRQCFFVD